MRLADVKGREQGTWSTVLRAGEKTPESLCQRVHEGLDALCHEAGVSRSQVLHLTAGAPGITDSSAGVVLSAPNLKNWNNVPLRSVLEAELGMRVAIENDTNLAALGEHRSGAAQGIDNFVFLAVGTGLGSGIVVNGRLLPGAHWSAGEVGYLGIRGQAREAPRFRATGQIERVVGGAGIERRWQAALAASGGSDLALQKLRASQILDRAQTGDLAALEVLQTTATLLADAITDIALLLDPELVVLGGGVGSHPALCPAVEACLAENELARPRLRPSALGAGAQLDGGISVSLAELERRLPS